MAVSSSLLLALGLPLVLFAILTFDQLVLLLRSAYASEWERCGRPRALLRRRSEFPWSFSGWLAAQRCSFAWVFVTPAWARTDPNARRLLLRLRLLVGTWNLVV